MAQGPRAALEVGRLLTASGQGHCYGEKEGEEENGGWITVWRAQSDRAEHSAPAL